MPVFRTNPAATTLPRAATARAVRTGMNRPAPFSVHLEKLMKADLDGADRPGSNEGPVQNTTQPKRKGVRNRAPGNG